MLADQLDESQDSLILEGFDISDLNQDTIKSFRNRLRAIKPNHPWISLDDKAFLYKLSAYDKDRKTGKEGITTAGLLMFGEDRAIIDEFPKYFLDYREKISEEVRWDYRLPRGIVIEKGKTYFKLSNPGNLRITREEALKGGVSDPRNENIFKMFNLLGIGERAGSGLENIQIAWKEQEWLSPDLEELYDPDRIVLTLRTVSMLPEQSIILLKSVLKNKYNELSREEVMALVAAHQEEYVTNNRLQQLLDTNAINSSKILSSLVDKDYLEADGIGRGTKYYLTEVFKNVSNENINETNNNKSFILGTDEKKVLDYIIENEFINTKICTSELGFGRTKSKEIFNKLIQLDKVKRIGIGAKTRYVLVEFNVEK